jgi:hypothetical protein
MISPKCRLKKSKKPSKIELERYIERVPQSMEVRLSQESGHLIPWVDFCLQIYELSPLYPPLTGGIKAISMFSSTKKSGFGK